jgi:hypothetical protein
MGLIKKICICGADYCVYGLREKEVLSELLIHKFGGVAAVRIDKIVRWSQRLAEDRAQARLSRRLNCWEANKCPAFKRLNNGETALCPTPASSLLDGIHGGFQSGRACWAIDETLCGGKRQGDASEKVIECGSCGFYETVRQEEGKPFFGLSSIHNLLSDIKCDPD